MAQTELAPGSVIAGAYEIEPLVGRGGMGAVYRALEVELDRHVAIKVAASGLANMAEFRARLLEEMRLVAAIEHPAVVSVRRLGEVGDRPYIVMQWIDGADLRTRMAAGPLPMQDALAIVDQLAGALDAAHAAGCIHGDVKPANVLIRDCSSAPTSPPSRRAPSACGSRRSR